MQSGRNEGCHLPPSLSPTRSTISVGTLDVDPGDHRQLGAVSEEYLAYYVHLPQLHRPGALPAAVVLATAPALLRLDQAVTDEGAIDRRARRHHLELPSQAIEDGSRTPSRMRPPQRHDPGLDGGIDLVWAAVGL